MSEPAAPPDVMINMAVGIGGRSPCAKSKRGAVIYQPDYPDMIIGFACNSMPEPFTCSGSETCREACSKRCVHAEQRAIFSAAAPRAIFTGTGNPAGGIAGAHLVHAKVVNGELVAGGGPSCWQCSRMVLDVGLGGVWLYEDESTATRPAARWRFYDALRFHRLTLIANGLPAQFPLRFDPDQS